MNENIEFCIQLKIDSYSQMDSLLHYLDSLSVKIYDSFNIFGTVYCYLDDSQFDKVSKLTYVMDVHRTPDVFAYKSDAP